MSWFAAALALSALALSACGSARAPEPRPALREKGPERVIAVSESLPAACVTTGPERCFDATDDNCNGVIDEGCGVETGPVQFAIAWEPAEVDVDLLVTDPQGELAEVGRKLPSGLLKQRDCPGRSSECRGKNLENVYLDGAEAPRGAYHVRIVLESLGGKNPPVRVRFGARVGPKAYGFEINLDRPDAVYTARFDL